MSQYEKLGMVAKEYMDAMWATKTARQEYKEARDKFLSDKSITFREAMHMSDFHEATDNLFESYKLLRDQEYNAKRRLATQYRKFN